MRALTPRQRDILLYIQRRVMDQLPPTIKEIGEEFGIRSSNGVAAHLLALQRKGYISRSGRARGIKVVRWLFDERHIEDTTLHDPAGGEAVGRR